LERIGLQISVGQGMRDPGLNPRVFQG